MSTNPRPRQILKQLIILLLPFIGFGIVVAITVTTLLESRPEKEMAQSFLLSNKAVAEKLGAPITVMYTPEGSAVNDYASKTTGTYRFKISGSKRSGTVAVHWVTDTEHGSRVESIDLLHSPERPERIWQESER